MVSLDSVGRFYKDKIPNHKRGAGCKVMRKHAVFVEHVQHPDEIPINLACIFLVFIGPIIFAIAKPFYIGANKLTAIADVVDNPVFNCWR